MDATAAFEHAEFSTLYLDLCRPAGSRLLRFAGEATSTHHTWIVGVRESRYRAASAFFQRFERWEAKRNHVERVVQVPKTAVCASSQWPSTPPFSSFFQQPGLAVWFVRGLTSHIRSASLAGGEHPVGRFCNFHQKFSQSCALLSYLGAAYQ